MKMIYGLLDTLHHQVLYKNIHYLHHRQIISNGFGALFTHPLEHLIVNLLPIITSIFILNMDIILTAIFVGNLSWMTVQSHTVYRNKKSKSRHSIHHKYNYYNFDNYPYLLDLYLNTFRNN